MARVWVDGQPPYLNASDLNGMEADIALGKGVPDAALAGRIADQTSQTAAQLNATYGKKGYSQGAVLAALDTDGAPYYMPPLFALDTDGTPYYNAGGVPSATAISILTDTDSVPYFAQ